MIGVYDMRFVTATICFAVITVAAASGRAAQEVVHLPLNQAANAQKLNIQTIDGEQWTPLGGERGISIDWKLPATLAEGWYVAEFNGFSHNNPTEWRGGTETEPYRFFSGKQADAQVTFSFAVPKAREREVEAIRHPYLDNPVKVTLRRADRPLLLKAGDLLRLNIRCAGAATGDVRLIPAPETMRVVIQEFNTKAPYHLFDQKNPPLFQIKLATLDATSFDGQLELRWADALGRDVVEKPRAIHLNANGTLDIGAQPPQDLKYGAYTLHAVLKDNSGAVITHQQRHMTYSPHCDISKIPFNSPFGNHIRPFDPMVPMMGLRHLRIFHDWRGMNPEPGRYEWSEMDAMIDKARKAGCNVLWVMTGLPKWASSKPDEKKYQTYPPMDWNSVDVFLKAFWERYAPGGKIDVIDSIEIWNEPNVTTWTSFTNEEYARLSKEIFTATRKYAPQAKVVGISQSGGLHMGFVNGVLDAGAGSYMDIASTHIYEMNNPRGTVSVQNKVEALQKAFVTRDLPKPTVWNTEVGVGSWGRWGEAITPVEAMVQRAISSPFFDPTDQRVKKRWLTFNERIACASMVRSSAQQIEMGVERIYYFKWQAGVFSLAHDWADNGNVVPKMTIPVQAVQSEFWRRYATETGEPAKVVASSNKDAAIYVHSFKGPNGRLWVAYAHPRKGSLVMGDEMAGAVGADNKVDAEALRKKDAGAVGGFGVTSDVQIQLPGAPKSVICTDILARDIKNIPAEKGNVALNVKFEPVYLIETKGDVWKEVAGK